MRSASLVSNASSGKELYNIERVFQSTISPSFTRKSKRKGHNAAPRPRQTARRWEAACPTEPPPPQR